MAFDPTGVITGGLGLILSPIMDQYQDRRQLNQQARLQKMQIEGNKELAHYGQELSYDMWQRTNYAAQVEQMKKAGLNTGLMYAKGGPGGTTGGVSAGNAGAAQAAQPQQNQGLAMQLGLQTAMQAAQIENIKADTQVKKTEAAKTAGVDTQQVIASIDQIKQGIKNAQAQEELTQTQNRLAQLEEAKTEQTWNEQLNAVRLQNEQWAQNVRKLKIENFVGYESADAVVQQATQAVQLNVLEMSLKRANIANTIANTEVQKQQLNNLIGQLNIAYAGKEQEWQKLSNQAKEIAIREMAVKAGITQTEFNTNWAAHLGQITNAIGNIIPFAGALKPTGAKPYSPY